ncbi:MAG: molybdenum hydroxylase, partial [Anaerolineae bacterium]|nr:molybdenum hydroxylase [Anaerolineae bacterium]
MGKLTFETDIHLVLIRGAGDLASGVAWRLHRCGFPVVMTELPAPLVVRRTVAFAEAVYSGETFVQGTHARL